MSTAWTLLASEICTDALQHLGLIDLEATASGQEMQMALRGLDTVLKELPVSGYHWPKLSGETALTWASVQTFTLPTDYYGNPYAWKTENGKKYPLEQIPHSNWIQMPDREAAGTATHFYIDPASVFYIWPVPTSDPGLFLQYQKIVDDASLAVTPDVLQTWKGSLAYGVADEISMKAGAPKERRIEVAQRWAAKKMLLLNSAIASEVISFEVRE